MKRYNPNQPRVPPGNSRGGEWASGASFSGKKLHPVVQYHGISDGPIRGLSLIPHKTKKIYSGESKKGVFTTSKFLDASMWSRFRNLSPDREDRHNPHENARVYIASAKRSVVLMTARHNGGIVSVHRNALNAKSVPRAKGRASRGKY